MRMSKSCNSANSASVTWLCCQHEMAVKVVIAVYGCIVVCIVDSDGLPQEQCQQCAFSHALGKQSPPDALQTASCSYLTNSQHTLMHMCIPRDDVHEQTQCQKWAACSPDIEGCTSLEDNAFREERRAVRVTTKHG
jgi:hypothetical protein